MVDGRGGILRPVFARLEFRDFRGFALAVGLVGGVAVGQTYVVNAAGGPGAQFTTIAAAVAAVPNGAVLLVRPGVYSGFTIDAKSLAVFADPGVAVDGLATVIEVKNLAANQAVVLHGVRANGGLAEARFDLQNCAGPVVLQRCGISPPTSFGNSGAQVSALDCADLHIVDCAFPFGGQLQLGIQGGRAVVARSTFGANSWIGPVRITGARVDFVDCVLSGWGVFGPTTPLLTVDVASTVHLLGSTAITSTMPTAPTWGIGPAGTVVVDPAVQVTAATPFAAGVVMVTRALPAVSAGSVPLGTLATATLRVPAGGIGGLFVGLATPWFLVTPFAEPLAIDPTSAVPLGAGAGMVGGSLVLPPLASLRGTRLCWQGWSYDPAGGWQVSNPIVHAVW